jgi:hypothetical protein
LPGIRPKEIRRYHVFLASPGDMDVERRQVRRYFEEYNRTTAGPRGLEFVVIDWENYSTTGAGRPQALITDQTLEQCRESLALVIGLMGQRFGTPTGEHESGTEEEFEWALERHTRTGWPEIKWFFRKVPLFKHVSVDPDEMKKELEQWEKVRAFKRALQQEGRYQAYYKEFETVEFADVLRNDLSLWLNDPSRPWYEPQPSIVTFDAVRALRQLRPPPADFTGREEEIEDILRSTNERGATICVVRGMGGVGKTELALAAANRLKD